eukprot:GHVU01123750.1.p1 GENE.GHVU01123750.1~~GHVU01123750.1.p1  ORF type:complete len:169 (-),score=34.30 GHVU01123750.1:567-1073(-)
MASAYTHLHDHQERSSCVGAAQHCSLLLGVAATEEQRRDYQHGAVSGAAATSGAFPAAAAAAASANTWTLNIQNLRRHEAEQQQTGNDSLFSHRSSLLFDCCDELWSTTPLPEESRADIPRHLLHSGGPPPELILLRARSSPESVCDSSYSSAPTDISDVERMSEVAE